MTIKGEDVDRIVKLQSKIREENAKRKLTEVEKILQSVRDEHGGKLPSEIDNEEECESCGYEWHEDGKYCDYTQEELERCRKEEEKPPEDITDEKECTDAGYYWYDDACHKEPKPEEPVKIEKKPEPDECGTCAEIELPHQAVFQAYNNLSLLPKHTKSLTKSRGFHAKYGIP